jgi:predicted outer membrane repeat protein
MFLFIDSPTRPSRRRRACPSLEPLEDRTLFSVFVVNTLSDDPAPDSGRTSLRQAIARAAASAGPDTIAFAPGLTGTITLTAGPLDIADLDLAIIGPGTARLSISGNDATRVFQIEAGSTVRLSGLTVTRGSADAGAALYSQGATVAVSKCAFLANHATGPTATGGAIYAAGGGTLTVSKTLFASNRADRFGGALSGGGDILGCTFLANSAGSGGGAIWQHATAGDIAMTDTTFLANQATDAGGAFGQEFDAAASTVTHCTFRGNRAGSGGAVAYVFSSPPTISASTFDANQATSGGGAVMSDEISRLRVENTTFTNNRAGPGGGGALLLHFSSGTLKNVALVGNQAVGGNGGGVLLTLNSSLTIADSLFKKNAALGTDGAPGDDGGSAAGGALALGRESLSARMTNTAFSGNRAIGGHGGTGANGGDAHGGAISDDGSLRGVSLAGSILKDNRALGGRGAADGLGQGGGIYTGGEPIFLDRNTRIRRNHASSDSDDLFGDTQIDP